MPRVYTINLSGVRIGHGMSATIGLHGRLRQGATPISACVCHIVTPSHPDAIDNTDISASPPPQAHPQALQAV